ncbi:MAG: hypothetical protein A4E45_02170 [Methanosaeta sp. PtaB.Bin039]|nr:MAG: hypothetical protein A4E45_02170 [Methanosaeta sp. PtaB.Bin039]
MAYLGQRNQVDDRLTNMSDYIMISLSHNIVICKILRYMRFNQEGGTHSFPVEIFVVTEACMQRVIKSLHKYSSYVPFTEINPRSEVIRNPPNRLIKIICNNKQIE